VPEAQRLNFAVERGAHDEESDATDDTKDDIAAALRERGGEFTEYDEDDDDDDASSSYESSTNESSSDFESASGGSGGGSGGGATAAPPSSRPATASAPVDIPVVAGRVSPRRAALTSSGKALQQLDESGLPGTPTAQPAAAPIMLTKRASSASQSPASSPRVSSASPRPGGAMASLRTAMATLTTSPKLPRSSSGERAGERASPATPVSEGSPRPSPRNSLTGFIQRRLNTPRQQGARPSSQHEDVGDSAGAASIDDAPPPAQASLAASPQPASTSSAQPAAAGASALASSPPLTLSSGSPATSARMLSPRSQYVSYKLIDSENDVEFYAAHFLDREHTNLYTPRGEIVSLGAVTADGQYFVKVWTATGFVHLALPAQLVKRGALRIRPTVKARLQPVQHIVPSLTIDSLRMLRSPRAPIDLAVLEVSQMVKHYKFGVILMREGQELENDMYSNAEPLPAAYEQFLDMLGERVLLKGHKGYRAGLDVKSDTTGTHSVYTTYRDFEIMFHVSTMLPLDPLDAQQLHRKRHIGNDIVVVVFNAGTTPFNPAAIRSNFNHVFVVVQCDATATPPRYKVAVAAKAPMSKFGPSLPPQGIFVGAMAGLREWLLTKLINGERASYNAPAFKHKIAHTRRALLQDVIDKHK
jgi:RAP1 GTPase activating protein 1